MSSSQMPDIPFSIIVASIVCGAIYIIVGTWLSKNEEKLKEKKIKDRCDFIFLISLLAMFVGIKFIVEYLGYG